MQWKIAALFWLCAVIDTTAVQEYQPSSTKSPTAHPIRQGPSQGPANGGLGPQHQQHYHHEDHITTRNRRRASSQDNDILVECGFDENSVPSPEELAQEVIGIESYKQAKQRLYRNSSELVIPVPTYFHIIQQLSHDPMVSDQRVYKHLNYLNDAFSANAPFRFILQDITRTVNTEWSNNGMTAQYDYKSILKVGGAESLNIYIVNQIPIDEDNTQHFLAGFAYLPSPDASHSIHDGIVLARTHEHDQQRLNTLVHETGHFLGLLHTFSDNSCVAGLVGDGVADTPQHLQPDVSFSGCRTWDSCQNLPGMDPVQNFMTYSRDTTCRTHFTSGQVDRMEYQWHLYRAPSNESSSSWTNRPTTVPPQCANVFGGCVDRDCCWGNCWTGFLFGLWPDFCFF